MRWPGDRPGEPLALRTDLALEDEPQARAAPVPARRREGGGLLPGEVLHGEVPRGAPGEEPTGGPLPRAGAYGGRIVPEGARRNPLRYVPLHAPEGELTASAGAFGRT